jgi:uncharacterized repeat protein (TIGR03803 family)
MRFVTAAITIAMSAPVAAYGQTPGFSVLYSFTDGTDGGVPTESPLIQDTAGVLYGTVGFAGNLQCVCGGVYSLVPSTGAHTTLYDFTGPVTGAGPSGSVNRDSRGNLYGTTVAGGSSQQAGVVYRLSPSGQETVLHSFDQIGDAPSAGLIGDGAGNLYGTTGFGGSSGLGSVFRIDATGAYTVIHNFPSATGDGEEPHSNLLLTPSGNLLGSTLLGGDEGVGALFRLNPNGDYEVLHSFERSAGNGAYPESSGVVADAANNLYGVTEYGGVSDMGVVYKLDAAGVFSVIYSFTGGSDGGFPIGKLFIDQAGRLYGTASEGGNTGGVCAQQNPGGCGVLFEVDPSTGQEKVLYSFTGITDGYRPDSGLTGRRVSDSSGVFYELFGTAAFGGDPVCTCGIVFRLTIQPE